MKYSFTLLPLRNTGLLEISSMTMFAALAIGCTPVAATAQETGTETASIDDSESSESVTDTGCPAGQVGCPCDIGNSCEDGLQCIDGICDASLCGDGQLGPNEACDDGNQTDSDGCNVDCVLTQVVSIDAGGEHTCALLNSGAVKCWGRSDSGQLGQGDTNIIGDAEMPASVPPIQLGGKAIGISAGHQHNCALLKSHDVVCWGAGSAGQLGYANTDTIGDDELPFILGTVDIGGPVATVDAGQSHTCVLLESGYVTCWGNNNAYQLGTQSMQQNIGDDEHPGSVGVLNVGGVSVAVATAVNHTCALRDNDELLCWGQNTSGQLGTANTQSVTSAMSAVGAMLPSPPIQFDLGESFTCAVLGTEQVACWGAGNYGSLGYGTLDDIGDDEPPGDPVSLGASPIKIATGIRHSCAIVEGGGVLCWGAGQYGQLGYGNTQSVGDDEVPSSSGLVDVGGAVIDITLGQDHTCALLDTYEVVCWGRGDYGALGYGSPLSVGDDEPPSNAGVVDVF